MKGLTMKAYLVFGVFLLLILATGCGCKGDPSVDSVTADEVTEGDVAVVEDFAVVEDVALPTDLVVPEEVFEADVPSLDVVEETFVEVTCAPECDGKTCGDDGCEGSCGECAEGVEECLDGVCTCVPDCDEENQCGSDACEGTCGECDVGFECVEDKCVCDPNCDDRECGGDGCEGSCGECEANELCNEEAKCECVPNCEKKECGTDGCGENHNCGECDLFDPDANSCNPETFECEAAT